MNDAPMMAERLRSRPCIPDLLLSSSAQRAKETSSYLTKAFQLTPRQFELHDELYLASPDTLLKALSNISPDIQHVMIVAHNPGLEALCDLLAGKSLPPMPTFGVRQFQCTSITGLRQLASASPSPSVPLPPMEAPASLVFSDYPKSGLR